MKRTLSTLIFFLVALLTFGQTQRPKVAVVLSGGGAKGVAHVRALKVIEEAGIPVDMVVGTSMGALIGGLYASGYTTAQLDSIINQQNWMNLLMDREDRSRRSLDLKQKTEPYMLSASFEKSPFEVIEGGFLKGNSVSYLISELTADRLSPMRFDDLPIPFACIATDIVSGKEAVLREGILAEALRSSMAIPGVFPPVKIEGKVLVDGGLKNNFPVDVAHAMGADYVIGVSVASEGLDYDELHSTLDVLMQVLDVVCCANKVEDNRNNTDVYMHVDVKGYSAASFTSQAIDTLLVRGEAAARSKWERFEALRDTLEHYGALRPVVRQPKHLKIDYDNFSPPPSIYNARTKSSFIGVGARFDNEELASLLLGGEYEFNHKNRFCVGANVRLGKRIDGSAYAHVKPWREWETELRYRYSYSDTKLYNEGHYLANPVYSKHSVHLDVSRSWRQVRTNFGVQYSHLHHKSLLLSDLTDSWASLTEQIGDEGSLSYYFSLQFDNMDSRLLPRRGMKWLVKYNYVTDNGYGFNDGRGLNIVEGYWRMAIQLSPTTILTPSVEGRFVQGHNTYLNHLNFIGGIGTFGHYVPQQLSFPGINYYQIAPNQLVVGGLNLRQHLTTNNYIFSQFNYGLGSSTLLDMFDQKHIFGAAAGYGYKSPAGPIELSLNWSNVTRKLGCFLNIGYMF